jgi:hypothetical protein
VFEEYDLPGLKTVNGIAEIAGNYPSKGVGERGAWFRDRLPCTSKARKLAIGSATIVVARTMRARCCRSGSWRRSGRQ